ncbi:ABC transporter permease subunit [Labrys sp. KNU-23]|uniref:ABC transporter permease subunit n=1 Tax=Labrys sp. KNU-23 TaxID=2789216 RepID=UPI0011EC7303|nr:ABC transporter permease subunit [Labrys sp. KNU-23]QEN84940.1 ABC transporter permease subunit [Labrys sp. KNU-23]
MELVIAYGREILGGLSTTLSLFLISLVIGFALATSMAFVQIRYPGLVSKSVWNLMFCIRGVPMLLVLYVIYYGLPLLPIVRETFLWSVFSSPFWCTIICLAIVEMAFTSEIMRGAYFQTPREQIEAARSLGLNGFQTFRVAILPAMIRNGFAAYTTEVILLCKTTALAFTVTVMDVMGFANEIRSRTLDVYQPLLVAGVIYLCITITTRLVLGWIFSLISVSGSARLEAL